MAEGVFAIKTRELIIIGNCIKANSTGLTFDFYLCVLLFRFFDVVKLIRLCRIVFAFSIYDSLEETTRPVFDVVMVVLRLLAADEATIR